MRRGRRGATDSTAFHDPVTLRAPLGAAGGLTAGGAPSNHPWTTA